MADALSPTMTLRDFENGYWYLDQLKNFAERIHVTKDFIVEQARRRSGRSAAAGG